jgi:hypothetical protein
LSFNALRSLPQGCLHFVSNKDFLSLNEEEKLWIKELINLYEYLKRSSLKMEGNEDDILVKDVDGKTYILKDGRFFDVELGKEKARTVGIPKSGEEKSLDELRVMLNRYPVGSLERKAIEEEIARMSD